MNHSLLTNELVHDHQLVTVSSWLSSWLIYGDACGQETAVILSRLGSC